MSRSATATNGILGVWDDGDDAGAGTKGVTVGAGGTGLNANWETLDVAVGTEHNADGTHKSNKIKGSNLVQSGGDSCVDGSTLEFNANAIRLKDGGISTAKIANDAVDKTKIAADVAGTGLDQDADGSLKVHVDASTIDFNTDALEVQTDGLPFEDLVFTSNFVAGSATGNTPTMVEWIQSDNVYTAKIYATFQYKSHHKYLKLWACTKTSNASYDWYVKLEIMDFNNGGSSYGSGEDHGSETSYYPLAINDINCAISIDLSALVLNDGECFTAVVYLKANKSTGVDATMKGCVIKLTSK